MSPPLGDSFLGYFPRAMLRINIAPLDFLYHYSRRAGEVHNVRDPDKQAVLDDTGHVFEDFRQRRGPPLGLHPGLAAP